MLYDLVHEWSNRLTPSSWRPACWDLSRFCSRNFGVWIHHEMWMAVAFCGLLIAALGVIYFRHLVTRSEP